MAHPDLATHYEQLRRHALMGTTSSASVGLVVLLRQGLAAWILAVRAAHYRQRGISSHRSIPSMLCLPMCALKPPSF
jgi:hypothetical protein